MSSLVDTVKLIEESMKIVDASGNEDEIQNPNKILNLILQIVTGIDNSMKRMETSVNKQLVELKKDFLGVSSRVRSMETQLAEFGKKLAECENNCKGLGNLFDASTGQIKNNTRNIIHHDIRIKNIERSLSIENPIQDMTSNKSPKQNQASKLQPSADDEPRQRVSVLEKQLSETQKLHQSSAITQDNDAMENLKDSVLDLQCRFMKNNLIFSGLAEQPNENIERKLHAFLFEQLGIEHHIQLGNVHRFGKKNRDRPRPIVARFIFYKDLKMVLDSATWLKNTPFGIQEQFPKVIEDKRRKLYPVFKEAKRQGKHATLVRDKLFIDGEQYFPGDLAPTNTDNRNGYRDSLLRTPKEQDRPFKRQRRSDSSRSDNDQQI